MTDMPHPVSEERGEYTARIEIGQDEYVQVFTALRRHVGSDDRLKSGIIELLGDGTSRWWTVHTPNFGVILHAGPDQRSYKLAIPPRVFDGWPVAAGEERVAAFCRRVAGDTEYVCVEGSAGETSAPHIWVKPTESYILNPGPVEEVDAVAELLLGHLKQAIRVMNSTPAEFAEEAPITFLDFQPDKVMLNAEWPNRRVDQTTIATAARVSRRDFVSFESLAIATAGFDDDEPIQLVSREEGLAVVEVHQGDLLALIPLYRPSNPLRGHVENVITKVFGPDAAGIDEEGNYALTLYGPPIYGHLLGESPPFFRVYSDLLEGVEVTPDLLAEINDLNKATLFGRLVATDDGVHVIGELVAETLDPLELASLVAQVQGLASKVGPVLTVRFGGTLNHQEQDRWANYLRTAVHAEISPGHWMDLSGGKAKQAWNLPDEVFVLTGFNPFGRRRSAEQNRQANNELVAAIHDAGGSAMRALGESLEGEYGEPSVLTWGLTQQQATEIAHQFSQEAFFKLTSTDLEIVSVRDNHHMSRPRLAYLGFDDDQLLLNSPE